MGFSFDGVHSDTLGITLKVYPFPAIPSIRNRTVEIPGRPGVWDFGSEFGTRVFELPCIIQQSNRTDLMSIFRDLAKLFNPQKGVKKLILDEQPNRYYLARIFDAISAEQIFTIADFTLTMVCPDPFGYIDAKASTTLVANPADISVVSAGDLDAGPVFTIAGACGNLTIANLTTGTSLVYTGSLGALNTLVIDMNKQTVTLDGTTNVMANISNGDFWSLSPGLNSLRITSGIVSSVNTTIQITWSDKYLT